MRQGQTIYLRHSSEIITPMQDTFRLRSGGQLPYPIFFPDATRGYVRELSWEDVNATGLPGVLVNTFHLLREKGEEQTREAGGIRPLLGYQGAIISDSGGFQVMSMVKAHGGKVTNEGVVFTMEGQSYHFSPEDSIRYQLTMKTDLCVVLDDFTPPNASHEEAEETVVRTTEWAKRCKAEFERINQLNTTPINQRPYLIGVVQGGEYEDLRMRSIKELTEIGFDGYGYGGFPLTPTGEFDVRTAKLIAENVPRGSLLYGLGIGKPDDIVKCVKSGWQIFDCVLPTRDARHGRLYVYKAESKEQIDLEGEFYEYYNPRHASHLEEEIPVSPACDCELCTTITRAELAKRWRERDRSVLRLATIHNLRFYAMLMGLLSAKV